MPALWIEQSRPAAATPAMPPTPPPGVSEDEWNPVDVQPPLTTAAPPGPGTGSDAVRSAQRERLLRAVAQLVSNELTTLARSGEAPASELQRLADLLDSVLALQTVPPLQRVPPGIEGMAGGGRRDF